MRVQETVAIAAPLWTVTELTPGRSFAWTSRASGLVSVGDHRVDAPGTAQLTFSQTGPLGSVLGLLMTPLIRSYVRTEAASLKARCES